MLHPQNLKFDTQNIFSLIWNMLVYPYNTTLLQMLPHTSRMKRKYSSNIYTSQYPTLPYINTKKNSNIIDLRKDLISCKLFPWWTNIPPEFQISNQSAPYVIIKRPQAKKGAEHPNYHNIISYAHNFDKSI